MRPRRNCVLTERQMMNRFRFLPALVSCRPFVGCVTRCVFLVSTVTIILCRALLRQHNSSRCGGDATPAEETYCLSPIRDASSCNIVWQLNLRRSGPQKGGVARGQFGNGPVAAAPRPSRELATSATSAPKDLVEVNC